MTFHDWHKEHVGTLSDPVIMEVAERAWKASEKQTMKKIKEKTTICQNCMGRRINGTGNN
mgnify:CR=1 FL=1